MKFKDLTGKRFGRWVVLEEGYLIGKNKAKACLCRCDCGTIRVVEKYSLIRGKSKSCSCMGMPLDDLIGKRFGALTVIGKGERNKLNQRTWRCRCDCGNIKDIIGCLLRDNKIKSCGCMVNTTTYWKLSSIERNRIQSINKLRRGKNYTGAEWRMLFDEDFNYVFNVVYNFLKKGNRQYSQLNEDDAIQTMEYIFFTQYHRFNNKIDLVEFPPSREYFYKACINEVERLWHGRDEVWYFHYSFDDDKNKLEYNIAKQTPSY